MPEAGKYTLALKKEGGEKGERVQKQTNFQVKHVRLHVKSPLKKERSADLIRGALPSL